ncbi:EI24 domain-containing protein [Nocardioides acrostichi]|uniref:EI24 domain-containing protein n=1 Tax=Nocardioides acrostichi TaxID=2784339 RepID=A0A930Y7F5_9ACTN|nr:EI24 domain-containing protein [Nocardioides acrostichi]MBF4161946.1 EI24 domain-containing protein [Nocardioides acrostichi]
MPEPMTERGVALGVRRLADGASSWRTRPRLMVLGLVPALIVLVIVLASFVALLLNLTGLADWLTPFADDWGASMRGVVRVGVALVLLVGFIVIASVTFTGLTLAVGDPFYERIWRATEADLGGPVPDDGPSWWRSVLDACVLMAIGLALTLLVVLLGLLPFVGAVAGAVLGTAISGRLLAGELLSRPLAARGLDRRAQAEVLRRDRGAVLGFGVATQACFLIPLGGIAIMPVAVVGATRLARDLLGEAPLKS